MSNTVLQEVSSEQDFEVENKAYLTNSMTSIGLPNYRYVMSLLKASIQLAKRQNKVLLVLYFSLNNLTQMDDEYGHAIGDEALTIVAARLEEAVQKGDYSLYLGKNKYLVYLMMNRESLSEAETIIERLTLLVSRPINIDGLILKISASIGVAAYPMNGDKAGVLLNIAEMNKHRI